VAAAVLPEEIYYLYRWVGTGSFHLSNLGREQVGQNRGYAAVADFVRQRANAGEIPRGAVALQPHWKAEYPQWVASQIVALSEQQAAARERKEA
jgi:hypothetical protein